MMAEITIELPESLHGSVERAAIAHGVTVEHFVATAVSEKVARDYLGERARRASRAKYEAALAQVPDVEPEAYDRP